MCIFAHVQQAQIYRVFWQTHSRQILIWRMLLPTILIRRILRSTILGWRMSLYSSIHYFVTLQDSNIKQNARLYNGTHEAICYIRLLLCVQLSVEVILHDICPM